MSFKLFKESRFVFRAVERASGGAEGRGSETMSLIKGIYADYSKYEVNVERKDKYGIELSDKDLKKIETFFTGSDVQSRKILAGLKRGVKAFNRINHLQYALDLPGLKGDVYSKEAYKTGDDVAKRKAVDDFVMQYLSLKRPSNRAKLKVYIKDKKKQLKEDKARERGILSGKVNPAEEADAAEKAAEAAKQEARTARAKAEAEKAKRVAAEKKAMDERVEREKGMRANLIAELDDFDSIEDDVKAFVKDKDGSMKITKGKIEKKGKKGPFTGIVHPKFSIDLNGNKFDFTVESYNGKSVNYVFNTSINRTSYTRNFPKGTGSIDVILERWLEAVENKEKVKESASRSLKVDEKDDEVEEAAKEEAKEEQEKRKKAFDKAMKPVDSALDKFNKDGTLDVTPIKLDTGGENHVQGVNVGGRNGFMVLVVEDEGILSTNYNYEVTYFYDRGRKVEIDEGDDVKLKRGIAKGCHELNARKAAPSRSENRYVEPVKVAAKKGAEEKEAEEKEAEEKAKLIKDVQSKFRYLSDSFIDKNTFLYPELSIEYGDVDLTEEKASLVVNFKGSMMGSVVLDKTKSVESDDYAFFINSMVGEPDDRYIGGVSDFFEKIESTLEDRYGRKEKREKALERKAAFDEAMEPVMSVVNRLIRSVNFKVIPIKLDTGGEDHVQGVNVGGKEGFMVLVVEDEGIFGTDYNYEVTDLSNNNKVKIDEGDEDMLRKAIIDKFQSLNSRKSFKKAQAKIEASKEISKESVEQIKKATEQLTAMLEDSSRYSQSGSVDGESGLEVFYENRQHPSLTVKKEGEVLTLTIPVYGADYDENSGSLSEDVVYKVDLSKNVAVVESFKVVFEKLSGLKIKEGERDEVDSKRESKTAWGVKFEGLRSDFPEDINISDDYPNVTFTKGDESFTVELSIADDGDKFVFYDGEEFNMPRDNKKTDFLNYVTGVFDYGFDSEEFETTDIIHAVKILEEKGWSVGGAVSIESSRNVDNVEVIVKIGDDFTYERRGNSLEHALRGLETFGSVKEKIEALDRVNAITEIHNVGVEFVKAYNESFDKFKGEGGTIDNLVWGEFKTKLKELHVDMRSDGYPWGGITISEPAANGKVNSNFEFLDTEAKLAEFENRKNQGRRMPLSVLKSGAAAIREATVELKKFTGEKVEELESERGNESLEKSISGLRVQTKTFDEILGKNDATKTELYQLRGEPNIYILDFAIQRHNKHLLRIALLSQGDAADRSSIIPINEMENSKWIEAGGHDLSAEMIVKFFNKASEDNVELTVTEESLKKLLLKLKFFKEKDGKYIIEKPKKALISVYEDDFDRNNYEEGVTAQDIRREFLIHEVIHAETFTNSEFKKFAETAWVSLISDAEKESFKSFVGDLGYSTENEELMIDEFLPYLFLRTEGLQYNEGGDIQWADVKKRILGEMPKEGHKILEYLGVEDGEAKDSDEKMESDAALAMQALGETIKSFVFKPKLAGLAIRFKMEGEFVAGDATRDPVQQPAYVFKLGGDVVAKFEVNGTADNPTFVLKDGSGDEIGSDAIKDNLKKDLEYYFRRNYFDEIKDLKAEAQKVFGDELLKFIAKDNKKHNIQFSYVDVKDRGGNVTGKKLNIKKSGRNIGWIMFNKDSTSVHLSYVSTETNKMTRRNVPGFFRLLQDGLDVSEDVKLNRDDRDKMVGILAELEEIYDNAKIRLTMNDKTGKGEIIFEAGDDMDRVGLQKVLKQLNDKTVPNLLKIPKYVRFDITLHRKKITIQKRNTNRLIINLDDE